MYKILLVGNGGSLKEKNIADIIDSFDVVCRFNFGGSKVAMDRWSKYIGTKKNIWFNFNISNLLKDGKLTTNKYNINYLHSYDKIYISGIDWVKVPLDPDVPNGFMSTTNSIENFIDMTPEQFQKIQNGSKMLNINEVFETEIKNVFIFPHVYSELIRRTMPEFSDVIPSTGMKAIHYFLKEFDKIYICGFDGFRESHFYGDDEHNKLVKEGYQNRPGGHNGRLEMQYILKQVVNGKIEIIDEEIL